MSDAKVIVFMWKKQAKFKVNRKIVVKRLKINTKKVKNGSTII